MTLPQKENENILVFEKSKWIRKQKLTSNMGVFLEFFSQLILTTGSQYIGPYITVYYGIWTCVSTKIPKIYCESDRLQKMHSLSVLQIIFGEGSLSVFGRDKWSQKFYFVEKIF